MLFRPRKARKSPEAGAMYPVRAVPFETGEKQGTIVLLVPRYGESWFGKLCERILGRPFIRIPLDQRGSAFFLMCDGRRNFGEICKSLEEMFGEEVSPANERGYLFLKMLLERGCVKISWKPLSEEHASKKEG